MSVTSVHEDRERLQVSITAEFDAPPQQAWELWADPRRLERWWGPPDYPATVTEHALRPGGSVTYYMTGPDGERYHGWWRLIEVEAPHTLRFEDGFGDEDGSPHPEMPTTEVLVSFEERSSGGTRMAIETTFPSPESMEQLLAMGAEEGMKLAIGQMGELLGSARN
jgi:uncharacterized protein YndB with AHSA1/START domain